MNRQRHHIIQFSCIATLLAAIVLQGFTDVVKVKPLSPYTNKMVVKKQKLSCKTYLNGSYQVYLAQLARQNSGFREFFSRCHNQVAYTCFDKIANKNVIEGKQHEFYLKGNIDDVSGKLLSVCYGSVDYAKSVARKNVQETLTLIDTLHQHNTQFLFILCPTKPAVYPEYLPEAYRDSLSDFALAEYYAKLFKENNIPHIDFYSYFKTLKDSFPYPLYTRTGSHWSEASIPFVADSILRKMETVAGYDLPSIEIVSQNLTRRYTPQDGELENSLDLLLPLCKPKVPRPVFRLTDTLGKDRPNLLVVGDGYFVPFEKSCFLDAFNSWNYWKYNETSISPIQEYTWKNIRDLPEAPQILEDADIVMAVFTSNYLPKYMCGFIPYAMELYQQEKQR